MKRTTGKFDSNDQEIFEGDKVVMCWGWFTQKGKNETTKRYQIHTITVRKAHMMGNGEMHDDGGGITFNLGNASNFWDGKQVTKLTQEEVDKIGMKEDQDFFFDENEKAIRFTDQHFLGLPDEDWEKELAARKERRNEFELKLIFGDDYKKYL